MAGAGESPAARPLPARSDRPPERRPIRALRDRSADPLGGAPSRLPAGRPAPVLDSPGILARRERPYGAALAAVHVDGYGDPRVPARRWHEPDPLANFGAPPATSRQGVRARPHRRPLDLPRPRWPLASRRWRRLDRGAGRHGGRLGGAQGARWSPQRRSRHERQPRRGAAPRPGLETIGQAHAVPGRGACRRHTDAPGGARRDSSAPTAGAVLPSDPTGPPTR